MSIFEPQHYHIAFHENKPGQAPRCSREERVKTRRRSDDRYFEGPGDIADQYVSRLPADVKSGLVILTNVSSGATYLYNIGHVRVERPTLVRRAVDAKGSPVTA